MKFKNRHKSMPGRTTRERLKNELEVALDLLENGTNYQNLKDGVHKNIRYLEKLGEDVSDYENRLQALVL